jgi:hypothetical protein
MPVFFFRVGELLEWESGRVREWSERESWGILMDKSAEKHANAEI